MDAPRVSVVVPVYNRQDAIGAALSSATAQTYRSFEIVVVDDGSTDDTAARVASSYPSVRLLRLPRNTGVAAARNRGIAAARGELIAFLDSDDLWSPDKLAVQVADLDAHPEAVLSFSDVLCGASGLDQPHLGSSFQQDRVLLESFLFGNPIVTPSTVIVRKRHIDAVGVFDEELTVGEDRDVWLRLAAAGPIRFLPLPLVRRVVRRDSLWFSGHDWHAASVRIVERFLARSEGHPYRMHRRRLRTWTTFRLGILRTLAGDTRRGWRDIAGAVARDPGVAVRTPRARMLLAQAIAAPIVGTPDAPRLPLLPVLLRAIASRLANREIQRGRGTLARARETAFAPFRPPPDATVDAASPRCACRSSWRERRYGTVTPSTSHDLPLVTTRG
jgi:glycosyltransferase involved in cell wall biosynthesis